MRIVKMVEEGLTARKILTQQTLENAIMVCQAIGGSTNAALHLPALAHELGLSIGLEDFNRLGRQVPTLLGIAPNGPYGILDLYAAGGVQAVMKRLEMVLHTDVMTCTGKPLFELLAHAQINNPQVVPDVKNAQHPEGGLVALFGNIAPEGCIVKQSAVSENIKTFTGPARVFESEHDALAALRNKTISDGEVLVIRNEGPKGGPGMPETLAVTMSLKMSNYKRVAMITDGRFSGASSGPCVGHVSPEAADGGPIAAVENGDRITIDIPNRSIHIHLDTVVIEQRLKDFKNHQISNRNIPPGYMKRYVRLVTSAAKGAYLE